MKVTQQVEAILKESRMARNSDRHLMIKFMQQNGMGLTPHQESVFLLLPSLESVRRVRQKLQENGKYPADQKIARERDFKSMRMQQITPGATPTAIDNVLNRDIEIPKGFDGSPEAISWLND